MIQRMMAILLILAIAAALTLNVRVKEVDCPDREYQAVIFELTPQPEGHAVWTTLKEIREGFRCRQGPPFGGRAPVLSSGNNPIKEAPTA